MAKLTANLPSNIIVALRSARAAVGWNQEEFSKRLCVAKSTVARIETLEMVPREGYVVRAMQLFREAGIEIDFHADETVSMMIRKKAINEAIQRLDDPSMRRADRKGNNLTDGQLK